MIHPRLRPFVGTRQWLSRTHRGRIVIRPWLSRELTSGIASVGRNANAAPSTAGTNHDHMRIDRIETRLHELSVIPLALERMEARISRLEREVKALRERQEDYSPFKPTITTSSSSQTASEVHAGRKDEKRRRMTPVEQTRYWVRQVGRGALFAGVLMGGMAAVGLLGMKTIDVVYDFVRG